MTGTTALLRVALPLLVLNGLLTFGNRWPGPWPQPQWRLSAELAALLLVLLWWTAPGGARRRGPGPHALAALAAGTGLWVLLHYVDVTVPALLGRPPNAYWDGRHLWQVLRMAGADGAPWQPFALVAGAAVAFALLCGVVHLCLRALLRGLAATPPLRPALALAAAAVLLAGTLGPRFDAELRRAFAPPVAALLAEQGTLLAHALAPGDAARLGPGPAFDGDVGALAGADVLIVFAEAYGAVTLDAPAIAGALDEPRRALQRALEAGGRGAVSARVRSPTFGGASWLAHAELLAGLDMRDPADHRLLLASRRPTLVSHFARHGYRTVGWMPGLQRPWPEGAFYGFERREGADGIGYAGLAFGYWRIPDQASIALLQAQELAPPRPAAGDGGRRPRFVVFPTVSTHAPFAPLPPFVDDWRLAGAGAFHAEAAAHAPSAEPVQDYVAAMRYQFRWLAAWLREQAPADIVTIVVGDHQPVGSVTGPGASWDVPVHVISADRALLARLEAAGFTPGLRPAAPALGPMRALTPILLDAFTRR